MALDVKAEIARIDRAVRTLCTEDKIACAMVLTLAIEALQKGDDETFVECMSTLSMVADIVEAESN